MVTHYLSVGNVARFALFLILIVCAPARVFAQLSEGGTPYSYSHSLSEAAVITMPALDVAALKAEDAIEQAKGVPFRFAFPHEVDYSMKNTGSWEILSDGAKLWRLQITCPEATSINFTYSKFKLPAGATFFIYNLQRTELIGAFTSRNNKEDGMMGTGIVRGASVILEYYEPANVSFEGEIQLMNIAHGYKDIFKEYPFWTEDFGSSGSCNINANCPQGADWQIQKRSVAMILSAGGSRLCSGSMINNLRQDLKPYFLTANHCMSSTPSTWVIMFNYESPGCPNVNGPLNYTLSGTQTKAQNAASDFALLLLNEAPPDTYKVHWIGWSAIDTAASSGAGIHHPAGDIKKISFVSVPFEHDTWSGTPASSHWRTRWSAGVTEPGSSGSPIYDQNHRLVGQLHGGPSSCTASDKSDLYGKFSMSWNYGTTPATRLKDWLDPDNTGAKICEGWDPLLGTRDTIGPSKVTDLHTTAKMSSAMTLGWTAPSDTSFGGVKRYDFRYSTSPITDTASFSAATPAPTAAPKPAGQQESLTLNNLAANTVYYFALKSFDIWGNASLLSNVVKDTTYKSPAIATAPDSLKKVLPSQTVVTDSIMVSNTTAFPSTLQYTVETANNTFPSNAVTLALEPLVPENVENAAAGKSEQEETIFGQSVDGSGGPDSAGYKWIDSDEPNGPQYVWEDISATGTAVTNWTATGTFDPKDEGYAGPFDFGFPFKFYKQAKTQVYISTNGLLLFTAPTANVFTNAAIPTTATPNEFIAPFWDDLDGRTQGTVHYKQDGSRFIIQYTNWQKYSGTGSLTFQIQLFSSGKIMYYYKDMSATLNSATVGTENATGTTGLQIAYNANYVKNLLAVKISSEPDWLGTANLGGTLYNGNSAAVKLTFRSEDFPAGNYSMDVKIKSNDPARPVVTIPVKMSVFNPQSPITVTAPNGGENWVAGQSKNITWNSQNVTNVAIKYSTNNGTNWLPVTASVPAASGTYAWTVPNTPSTQALVRVSDASADTVFDVSNAVFTISQPPSQLVWECVVNVKDNGVQQGNLSFGQSPIATNGIDLALGEVSLPPMPPAGNFDARFELPVTPVEASVKDYRKDTLQSAVWTLKFQPGAQGYPFTFTWNPALLPAGNFMLKDLVNGSIVSVNMKTQNTYTLTNAAVAGLKIEYSRQLSVPMAMTAGWNMSAVPVEASDMSAAAIFSGANSSVFAYNSGYVVVTTLTNGKGYWVRYPAASNFNIAGSPVAASTVPLAAGWNMIGVYHNNATVANITTTPAGIINSLFFAFDNGYTQPTTLVPGKGYWVRTSAAGVMNLPASLAKGGEEAAEVKTGKDWGKIIVTDADGRSTVLYAAPSGSSTAMFSLPPAPPEGMFDVRFASQQLAEIIGQQKTDILIRGAAYPISITVDGTNLQLQDKATGGKLLHSTLRSGESVQISNNGISAVEVSTMEMPLSFELMQNYPNPFNPSTNIKFGVPEKSNIRLTVYNQLGETVATLLNGEYEAGYHSVEWNASNMTSGIYFYELKTEKFSSIKKLILMK